MNKRIEKLIEVIEKRGLSAIYISDSNSLFYLFGIRTSNGHFLLTKNSKIFYTDGRYLQLAKSLFTDSDIRVEDVKDIGDVVYNIFKNHNLKYIGIEFDKITLSEFENMKKIDNKIDYSSIDLDLKFLRMYKDDEEIEIIKSGVLLHEELFIEVQNKIVPGVTELEIKKFFDCGTYDITSLGTSFETIVAFGENSALPHYQSSNRKLKKGDTILIDSGINYKGYATDMTRTFFCDHVSSHLIESYELVYEAVQIAEKNIKVGEFTSQPHKKVVEFFTEKKVAEYYLHSLGHGVGIDIHEAPNLGMKDQYKFQNGSVFTIEPGLYYENIGGIRLENMYFISNEKLNKINSLDFTLKVI